MSIHQTERTEPYVERPHSMDTTNTLWLDSVINDIHWKASDRRDCIEEHFSGKRGIEEGYDSEVSKTDGTPEAAWDDIRRRERMAQACYE